MKRVTTMAGVATLGVGALIGPGCRPSPENSAPQSDLGQIQIALTQAPANAACLRVRIEGFRTVSKSLTVVPGETTVYSLTGLPTGTALVTGEAFGVACNAINSGVVPLWVTDKPSVARIDTALIAHVVLRLITNGRTSIAVDFESTVGGPTLPPPPVPTAGSCVGGASSSASPYMTPLAPGVTTKAIFTVGDSANLKPDGTPYKLVGLPDGMGAFDNGDGTFSLLVNHEGGSSTGIVRAHGAKGSFVSKWTIRKCDLAVIKGEDLIKSVATWNVATSAYNAPTTGVAFSRFCSADLPEPSAFFDLATGLGYDGRLFTNGEESGSEGRGMAHAMDGTSYELPRIGKYSFENIVANPATGTKTVVVGLDDSGGGQIYVYVGTKTASGTPVDRAGLTNGELLGLKVTGVSVEDPTTGIPSGTAFTMFPLGNVENTTGAALEIASNAAGITKYQRPEDGHWDPSNPNDFYFVTTASFTGNSRLWRLRFVDAANPTLGGRIDMLLDGSEGQKMFDNMTVTKYGHVYLQEDPGGQDYLAKAWRYDIASDVLTVIAEHDANRFAPGAPGFITRDEESSGIIDASNILGDGWFLLNVQAHTAHPDVELVEPGQILALFDPAAKKK